MPDKHTARRSIRDVVLTRISGLVLLVACAGEGSAIWLFTTGNKDDEILGYVLMMTSILFAALVVVLMTFVDRPAAEPVVVVREEDGLGDGDGPEPAGDRLSRLAARRRERVVREKRGILEEPVS